MFVSRTITILFLVLFTTLLPATGQSLYDSLKAEIDGDIVDSTRMRLLLDLAEEVGASDTILSFTSLEQAKHIAENLNDTRGLGRYYKILGKIFARSGSY